MTIYHQCSTCMITKGGLTLLYTQNHQKRACLSWLIINTFFEDQIWLKIRCDRVRVSFCMCCVFVSLCMCLNVCLCSSGSKEQNMCVACSSMLRYICTISSISGCSISGCSIISCNTFQANITQQGSRIYKNFSIVVIIL